jgi:hypothetical protein
VDRRDPLRGELLEVPLKWKRPRRIFVNSMSDLFHEDVHGDEIAAVLDVIKLCHLKGKGHVFQVLTKRAERMQALHEVLTSRCRTSGSASASRTRPRPTSGSRCCCRRRRPCAGSRPSRCSGRSTCDIEPHARHDTHWQIARHGRIERTFIDWVVAGGESGPGARPMHPDWARSLRDQCAVAGVPFFFKQWGTWLPRVDYYSEAAPSRSMGLTCGISERRAAAHHRRRRMGCRQPPRRSA